MVEICTVGGYDEVGKNMTAIKVDDEVIILDMGLEVEKYIKHTDADDFPDLTPATLSRIGAIPDIKPIKDWMKDVKAIIPTHAHLDHIGAIPFMSNRFDAPILCTPYTKEVINTILKDEKIKIKNRILSLTPNSTYVISDNLKIEFINMTHSTPQTVMVAIHTKEGIILYANDFKFDNNPVLGKKPNFKRLGELGKKGILCLIVDSIYSNDAKKTPSESIARDMLGDVLMNTDTEGKAIIITTFSSHLARLKSIVEFGKKLNRKILFLGRSLNKYVSAGDAIGIVDFSKDVKMVKYGGQIKKKLKKIQNNKSDYLIVVTGHQAEPKAVLTKISKGNFQFKFDPHDYVIFSCTVIPTGTNLENRAILEEYLRKSGVRIFKDVHVSGHASREDQRDLITLVNPEHIIPAHCEKKKASGMISLAKELGYKAGKTVHLMADGRKLKL